MEKIEANDTIIWAKEEKELCELREHIGYDFITVIEKRAGYKFIIVDELPPVGTIGVKSLLATCYGQVRTWYSFPFGS